MTVKTDEVKFKLSVNEKIINKPDNFTSPPGWKNEEFTPNELIMHLCSGFAFSQGVIKKEKLTGNKPPAGDIEEAWLIPIDIDNDKKVFVDGKYEKHRKTEADGYLSFEDVCNDSIIKKYALLCYTTPSHTAEHNRFRIVFLLEEPIKSPTEYSRVAEALLEKFHGDPACKNIDRLFYGNTNAEVVTFGNTIPNEEVQKYLKSKAQITEINEDIKRTDGLALSVEDIKTLLSQIPPQLGYTEWLRIVSAVGNYLQNDELATEIIEGWSPDVKQGTAKKIANRLKQPLISTLIYFAKLHGANTSPYFAKAKSDTYVTSTGEMKLKTGSILEKLQFIPLTDLGNSERFVIRNSDKVRFNWTDGCWYIWNGAYWERDLVQRIHKFAKETVRGIKEESKFAKDEFKEAFNRYAKASESRGKIEAMLSLAKTDESIACKQDDFDKNLYLFNCQNGVYDLKNNKYIPHKQELMLTKCATVDYDPDADCYAFEAFLDDIFDGDLELISFVQRLIGLSLCGAQLEEILVFCFGSGKNGKSVFFKVMQMLLGDYYQNAPAGMLLTNRFQKDNPTDVARLPNTRFVVASELPENGYLNESKVKDLTGGDTITARFLYQNEFSFNPTHTLWIFGNHKPKIMGTDNGIWRRICMIPFVVTISNEKRRPQAELLADFELEKSGILNWILKGWQDYQQNGLNPPAIVSKAIEEYRAEEDKLGDFLQECCVLGVEHKIEVKELMSCYIEFCKKNEEFPMKKAKMKSSLLSKGIIMESGNYNKNYYRGIALNNANSKSPEVFG